MGLENTHGGADFAVLESEENEIILCLHKWGEHEHPSMKDPNMAHGNGLILYFRTENMNLIRQNVKEMNCRVEKKSM